MHTSGFTHRDLKPGNMFIQRGRLVAAKIAVFGTTKYHLFGEMQTYRHERLHELAYTDAFDMWSFGIIAVELLTRWETRSDGWDSRSSHLGLNTRSRSEESFNSVWHARQKASGH